MKAEEHAEQERISRLNQALQSREANLRVKAAEIERTRQTVATEQAKVDLQLKADRHKFETDREQAEKKMAEDRQTLQD